MKASLILENGVVFRGESIGATADCVCELVFDTSMVGYQEILTDPSFAGQGVVMTYPLIGNYGVNSEDNESRRPWAAAFIVRRLSPRGSNFRNEGTLGDYLNLHGITGIQGVDTRAITRILRDQGTMNAMITVEENPDIEAMLKVIRAYRIHGAVDKVTRSQMQVFPGNGPKVCVMDFGAKESLIAGLVNRGCEVTAVPAHTPAELILEGGYDGVVLSDGPGDPADNTAIIAEVKKLYDAGVKIFGICLGHQLLALATGAKTEKLPYGHRGANQPVREIATGRVLITSQNHGYTVVADSVDPAVAEVSYVNVNDGSVEGLTYANGRALTVQFTPETGKGTMRGENLLDQFVAEMEGEKNA